MVILPDIAVKRTIRTVLVTLSSDLGPVAAEVVEALFVQTRVVTDRGDGSVKTVLSVDIVLAREVDIAGASGSDAWTVSEE